MVARLTLAAQFRSCTLSNTSRRGYVCVYQVLNERLAKMMSFIDFVEDQDTTSTESTAVSTTGSSAFDSRYRCLCSN